VNGSYVDDLVNNFVEIQLFDQNDFLKIRETLSRIGIAGKVKAEGELPSLFQSCHILYKRNRYYIVHFKEMFALDGKTTNFSDEDLARRNTIAVLLEQWGLLKILNPARTDAPRASLNNIRIISHKEKANWVLVAKYDIGKRHEKGKEDPAS